MSIVAGRIYLALVSAMLVICLVWFWVAQATTGFRSSAVVAPIALGIIAVVGLFAGLLMFPSFVEAKVSQQRIFVRFVLKRRRIILASEVDEIVLLNRLILPSRTASSQTLRVLLRRGGRTILAFTPRNAEVLQDLERLGISRVVDSDPMTPLQATRRYGGAAGVGEILTGSLVWVAIAIPAAVFVWMLWELAN